MSWTAVAAKDLRSELRSRHTLIPLLVSGVLMVAVGALAFHDVHERGVVLAGTLWMALAFAASLGLARAFGEERDRGTLETLLALPIERGALYLGKAVAQFVVLLTVGVVLLGVHAALAPLALPSQGPALLLALVLGCAGLAATGTLLSALAAQTRGRDLLLPVLLLPLAIPIVLSTVHATAAIHDGRGFEEWRGPLMVLLGYDVAFASASWLLAEQAVGT